MHIFKMCLQDWTHLLRYRAPNSTVIIIFFKYALVYFAHRTGAPEPILVCRENHKESLSSIFFKEVLSNVRIIK